MGIKGRVTWQQEWVRITQYKCHANSMWYWPANMISKPIEYSSSTTLPPHTPQHIHITHTTPHITPHHSTSLHNTPSTISILPPILRGLSSNNISGGPTITLYYDSFHLHFPFQPLCLHILILTTRRLEWTGRGKPPLRVGRPWIRRRYFIPIRIDGV